MLDAGRRDDVKETGFLEIWYFYENLDGKPLCSCYFFDLELGF